MGVASSMNRPASARARPHTSTTPSRELCSREVHPPTTRGDASSLPPPQCAHLLYGGLAAYAPAPVLEMSSRAWELSGDGASCLRTSQTPTARGKLPAGSPPGVSPNTSGGTSGLSAVHLLLLQECAGDAPAATDGRGGIENWIESVRASDPLPI